MRKLWAITALTLRSCTRSRLFLSLLVAVLLIIVLLPLTLKGDGSASGYAQITLHYTLTLVTGIMAAGTVWIACHVAASEIEKRQVYLLVTKPVRSYQVWLGKWMALLVMNAVVLATAGLCTSVLLSWQLDHVAGTPEEHASIDREILVARTMIVPEINKTPAPDDRARTVQPGETKTWRFIVPGALEARSKPLYIRMNAYSPQQLDLEPTSMTWSAGPAEGDWAYEITLNEVLGEARSLVLPPGCISEDGDLYVSCLNTQSSPASAIRFDRVSDLRLLIPNGSFRGNMFRALLTSLFKLGLLAGLALTMGSIFSMPVATFASFSMIIVFSSGNLVSASLGYKDILPYLDVPGFVRAFVARELALLSMLLEPMKDLDVLPLLPRGEFIAWSTVRRAFIVLTAQYTTAMGVLGSVLFKLRELGLPTG